MMIVSMICADLLQVDELWESMSHSAISLISGAVQSLNDADVLLKVTGIISLFIQTMEVRRYQLNGRRSLLRNFIEPGILCYRSEQLHHDTV